MQRVFLCVKIGLVCTKVEAGELTSKKYPDLSLDHHRDLDFSHGGSIKEF